jgi:NAD(P)-dependent dehydrogenase (short-subunit alcohol dehydrogenase family)
MFASVLRGIQDMTNKFGSSRDVFILPIDVPVPDAATFEQLARAQGPVRIPTFHGITGHPIYLSAAWIHEHLLSVKNLDPRTARLDYLAAAFAKHIQVSDPRTIMNINTPQAARAYELSSSSTPKPVALITGAAGGIGDAITRILDANGYCCVLTGRNQSKLDALGATLTNPWLALSADLADLSQVEPLVHNTLKHFGRLDCLINNAGWSRAATIEQTDETLIREVFTLNAMAPALLISKAWPHLMDSARVHHAKPVIINISSMATKDPFDSLYAYAAAKASVNLLALSASRAGGAQPHNIRAFSIAPGAVETPLLRAIVDTATLPTEHTLTPDQVAQRVIECVQGKHDDKNGQTLFMPSGSS